jgi:hypothetical protein
MQVLRCPAQIAKAPRRYLDHLCCLWIEIITIARVTLRLKHSSALFQFKTAARRAIKMLRGNIDLMPALPFRNSCGTTGWMLFRTPKETEYERSSSDRHIDEGRTITNRALCSGPRGTEPYIRIGPASDKAGRHRPERQ